MAQKVLTVGPTRLPDAQIEEVAFLLAVAYRWLTTINVSRRKRVQFPAPPVFYELAKIGVMENIPDAAEWISWCRIYENAINQFFVSTQVFISTVNIEAFRKVLPGVMDGGSCFFSGRELTS